MTKQMQKEISIFRQVTKPVDLPANLIAQQPTFQRAIKLCMDESVVRGRSNQDWADLLGCSKGYVNQVYNGGSSKHGRALCFNLDELHTLQVEAGNWAINQWCEMRSKGLLNHQSTNARRNQLLAELAELEAQEGAA